MTQVIVSQYLFYPLAAALTTVLSYAASKIPAFKQSNLSKSLPLVFGKSISIHVVIASFLVVMRLAVTDGGEALFTSWNSVLIQGMSVAGLAMLLENIAKVLFSREYSANVKILNSEKLSQISEMLTANYAGFSKLNWLQKLGIVTVIDVDLDNVFKQEICQLEILDNFKQSNCYKHFRQILGEYINVDNLKERIYELYTTYKKDLLEQDCESEKSTQN